MENLLPASAIIAIKNSSYVLAFIAGATYLGLSHESIVVLSILILLDIITGVAKAGVVKGWRTITSSRLAAGVLAKSLLVLVPIILAMGGKGIGVDLTIMAQGALTVLILSELYSVIGNIHAVQSKKEKNEFDAMSIVVFWVREVLENTLKTKGANKLDTK